MDVKEAEQRKAAVREAYDRAYQAVTDAMTGKRVPYQVARVTMLWFLQCKEEWDKWR